MSTLRSRASASLSLVASFVLAVPAAQALKSDREQPLEVAANHFATNQNKHLTVLTGAVKLTRGTMKGESDKGTVYQSDDDEINRVVLEGKPARLQQQLDSGGLMRATAANIDYDTEKATAVLTGNAVVIQEGRGEFRGERIVYNTETGELTGEGAAGGGITMKMQPKAKSESKPADKDKKK
ncbi:lipopolysaccharide transport periplasmic protein LptA [Tahibacter sp.]|uniref:lipopolysaccharide transport periplasmic protein LptA n=1 Tax=Tahibacter sp. TaxID=2056211 RepID=UPI002D7FF762|nr:lipopolysaccharide transport periplasmic protein LptA [Tahibacter sp.]